MIIGDDVRSYTCTHSAISIALTLHTHCTLALCQTLYLYLYLYIVYLAVVLNQIRSCASRQCELLPFFLVPVAIICHYGHGPRLKRCVLCTMGPGPGLVAHVLWRYCMRLASSGVGGVRRVRLALLYVGSCVGVLWMMFWMRLASSGVWGGCIGHRVPSEG